jgi:multiple sugar transport system substrate-binding protein
MKKLLLFTAAILFTFVLAGCSTDTTPPTISGILENGVIEVKVGSAELDLSDISATDKDGNTVNVRVTGAYDLNAIGDYDILISATDTNGFKISFNATLSVLAKTCDEDPDQDICKTDVDRARELYEGTIYNVDEDANGIPDWQEVELALSMGYSYYGDVDEDNAIWMNVLKFMEEYSNITVTRNPLYSSGWENGDDGLLLIQENALLEGTLPDIFFNPKGAETYDKGMTLDLKPYIDTDEEAQFITPNALSGMMTYDNLEMWGVPWQGVGPLVAVNVSLLEDLGIDAPSYDWTYAEYEALRDEIGIITDAGQCIFPGVIDFSYFGANYFDSVPNGYRGYNTVTQRFDFAGALGYGAWLESVAAEAKRGWHYWDLTETDRETLCPDVTDSWTDGVRGINTIYLWAFNSEVNNMVNKGFEIDIYPYPIAPDGGQTATYTYHDYYSLSKLLEADRVQAEAAFQLIKWLTFGEDGLESRWSLIDELNVLDDDGVSPFINGDLYLMDFIQGWPITSNPAVMAMHPLVAGFAANSGGLDRYNFAAFQNPDFQYQMSNANPYPRQIPAFASVANNFEPWTIKDQMRDEGLSFIDIAPAIQEDLNEQIVEFLQYYIGKND